MMLGIKYSNQSLKFLKKVDRESAERLLDKVGELQKEPFPQNVKRVEGQKLFRVRIGKHRILYEVDVASNFLGIIKIDKRGRVYD